MLEIKLFFYILSSFFATNYPVLQSEKTTVEIDPETQVIHINYSEIVVPSANENDIFLGLDQWMQIQHREQTKISWSPHLRAFDDLKIDVSKLNDKWSANISMKYKDLKDLEAFGYAYNSDDKTIKLLPTNMHHILVNGKPVTSLSVATKISFEFVRKMEGEQTSLTQILNQDTYKWQANSKKIGLVNLEGKAVGTQTTIRENGNLESTFLLDNKGARLGPFWLYDKEGTLTTQGSFQPNDNYILEGEYLLYHANGNIDTEGYYDNGYETGTWRYYAPDARLVRKDIFKKEAKLQRRETFHENGTLRLSQKFDDKGNPTGNYEEWYDTQQINILAKYNDEGLFEGEYLEYYPSGKPKIKGEYSGKYQKQMVGQWTYFNKEGNITRKETYDNTGQLMKRKDF